MIEATIRLITTSTSTGIGIGGPLSQVRHGSAVHLLVGERMVVLFHHRKRLLYHYSQLPPTSEMDISELAETNNG